MAYHPPASIPTGYRKLAPTEFKQFGDRFWAIHTWRDISWFGDEVGKVVTVIREIGVPTDENPKTYVPKTATERVKNYLKKVNNK